MQYLLLIYNDEQAWAALGPDERNAIVREYFALGDELRADGAHVAAAPLQPTSTARSKACAFACDGFVKPLILRTYCSAAARTSSWLAGGSKL